MCDGCYKILSEYIVDHRIEVENVPLEYLKNAFKLDNHLIIDDYVYGLKFVTEDSKHIFTNENYNVIDYLPDYKYEKGKIYHYIESPIERYKFNVCCIKYLLMATHFYPDNYIYSAGLWSFRCCNETLSLKKLPEFMNKIILVRYPIQTSYPINKNHIKGKIMEVVSEDLNYIKKFIKDHCYL